MEQRRSTAWMSQGLFGVMVHYLITPEGDTLEAKEDSLNRIVDGFDIELFLEQFTETGADWLIFTLGQNTLYYNCPNAVLDRLASGHTPRRDLARELATRVKALGKRFIAYLPADFYPVEPSHELRVAFGMDDSPCGIFQAPYQEFIRDFSLHLGMLNDGWWVDGAKQPSSQSDWEAIFAACRAGNPESLVAPSHSPTHEPMTPLQDYLAGETYRISAWRTWGAERTEEPFPYPTSRFIDGIQWHALLPIDESFTPDPEPAGPLYYSDAELFEWVNGCKANGGAVTLDMHIFPDGRLYPESLAQVCRLRQALGVY